MIRLRAGLIVTFLIAACTVFSESQSSAAERFCFGKRATIVGTSKADMIEGTPGRDVIVGLGGRDHVRGGAGNDLICLGKGGTGSDPDVAYGQRGSDRISGGGGIDSLLGAKGADRLYGGPEDDTLWGGCSIGARKTPCGFDGNDVLRGNGGLDGLFGERGRDVLRGEKGPDYLMGGRGRDRIVGGSQSDEVSYYDAPFDVTVDLRGGFARGGDGRDTLTGIENATGSLWRDKLLGNGRANYLFGGPGNDVIKAKGGNDCIGGGGGDNKLYGGKGFDIYDGSIDCYMFDDPGGSTVSAGTIDLEEGTASIDFEDSLLFGIEGAVGTWSNDRMIGNDGPNFFYGNPGNDRIEGGGGDDELDGAGGTDFIDGGDGSDECRSASVVVACENQARRSTSAEFTHWSPPSAWLRTPRFDPRMSATWLVHSCVLGTPASDTQKALHPFCW